LPLRVCWRVTSGLAIPRDRNANRLDDNRVPRAGGSIAPPRAAESANESAISLSLSLFEISISASQSADGRDRWRFCKNPGDLRDRASRRSSPCRALLLVRVKVFESCLVFGKLNNL
jgi:hypothetical protein